MMLARRVVIMVLAAAASGALAYLVTAALARGPGPAGGAPPGAEGAKPQAVLTAPELKHSEGGRLAWRVLLERANLTSGGSLVEASGLREGIIYDRQGRPAIRITADRVQADAMRKNFTMLGRVVVTSPKGIVITTDQVQWLNDEQRLHCPTHVTLKARKLAVTTTTLDYLVEADLVRCPSDVRMYSGNNRVAGRSLTYNTQTGVVDVVGGVQMVINPSEARQLLKELRKP
jgi:lipopolysaccharide export system protein LptA